MVEIGRRPPLVGGVRRERVVLDRGECMVDEERGVAVEVLEETAPAGGDDRVAVRGGVDRAEPPSFTARERDVAVAPGVQPGDPRVAPRLHLKWWDFFIPFGPD